MAGRKDSVNVTHYARRFDARLIELLIQ